ncbi:hypothetical protein WN55_04128 [Dufourea novaeangliae]|uniref:Uncharacterized protein n=1 Tax=Dufourea novaeangliae TaxID=178035 RepID=A0A154PLD4_DUFNO|nr:hypothetical protein WN55_04128 [Dufourea novaeangliae]
MPFYTSWQVAVNHYKAWSHEPLFLSILSTSVFLDSTKRRLLVALIRQCPCDTKDNEDVYMDRVSTIVLYFGRQLVPGF